jgi:large subunit ribosomal protein L10
MPITRAKKEKIVSSLTETQNSASAMLFADFFKLKTKDLNELRKAVKSLGGNIQVVKKTLAQKGLKNKIPPNVLARPGSVATIWFKTEDIQPAFKLVWQFSKKNDALKILGGWSDAFGGNMDADRAIALAKLPSRDILLGQLIGMLKYPLWNLAAVINAIQRSKQKAESRQ